MQPALLVRLRPAGPWRYGPSDGAPDRLDTLYRSDRLFSAVTLAMQRLGLLHDWLDATARNSEPAVVFSSLFPFQGETLFAMPPASLWPPPAAQLVAPNPVFLAKIRWPSATFVPLALIDTLLTGGQVLAEQWLPDAESGCLLRRDRPGSSPFRATLRRTAPIDRLRRNSGSFHSAACVEFEPGAGLWTVAKYRDTTVEAAWREPVEAAFRLLADSGFGGRRSSGWGLAETPQFERATWPGLILPKTGRLLRNGSSAAEADGSSPFWLLSLFTPAAGDRIDWSGGNYRLAVRAGRVESNGVSGVLKKSLRAVEEGSVLLADSEPVGAAIDVAPDGSAHPVYRAGFALALELPRVPPQAVEEDVRLVEEPSSPEEMVDRVCQPEEPAPPPALEEVPPAEPAPETQSEPPVPVASPDELAPAEPETPAPENPSSDYDI